jgi:hypothetical protein
MFNFGPKMGEEGFETFECHEENCSQEKTNVNSDVNSLDPPDLNQLVRLWADLSPDDRASLIALAVKLARKHAVGTTRKS